jgi:hypothetical protein
MGGMQSNEDDYQYGRQNRSSRMGHNENEYDYRGGMSGRMGRSSSGSGTTRRGFASMPKDEVRRIGAMGGRASHEGSSGSNRSSSNMGRSSGSRSNRAQGSKSRTSSSSNRSKSKSRQ